jgi:hypothetical protein
MKITFLKMIRNEWLQGSLAVRSVHHEFVSLGQTGKEYYYGKVLRCLTEQVRRKRSERWLNICGNASAYTASSMEQFLGR